MRSRAHTEEHARDSLENLLFSICRFKELTGDYPDEVTVVSYDFKKERFSKLHRRAVGFPADKFHFVGTEPPNETKARSSERCMIICTYVQASKMLFFLPWLTRIHNNRPDDAYPQKNNEKQIMQCKTQAQRGEEVALDQFRNDMYGCRGELLEKKLRRNPFAGELNVAHLLCQPKPRQNHLLFAYTNVVCEHFSH